MLFRSLSGRDLPKLPSLEERLPGSAQGVNLKDLEAKLQAIKTKWPELKTGVVRPEAQASYGDVIKIMDQTKKTEFEGVGLSPLG